MVQRNSGYTRIEGDNYATPDWPVELLLEVERFPQPVYEPAPGEGFMVRTLGACGMSVVSFVGEDFLTSTRTAPAIITNPPFCLADEFVRHALKLTEPLLGKVAMLLPVTFDTAKGRTDIFADHPAFARKLILTRRIRWANIEQRSAGPSSNHCWLIWDWRHVGPPTIKWPSESVAVIKLEPGATFVDQQALAEQKPTDQLDLVDYINGMSKDFEEIPTGGRPPRRAVPSA
jgi:hypothetical protein